MSTIGVMIGLLLTGQAFGIVMSGIGVIALAGIVVNNNIVLLDTYRNLRKLNANTNEVIIRTGVQRLRPILLTTLTTFFGLIPMASGISLNFTTLELSINSRRVLLQILSLQKVICQVYNMVGHIIQLIQVEVQPLNWQKHTLMQLPRQRE